MMILIDSQTKFSTKEFWERTLWSDDLSENITIITLTAVNKKINRYSCRGMEGDAIENNTRVHKIVNLKRIQVPTFQRLQRK